MIFQNVRRTRSVVAQDMRKLVGNLFELEDLGTKDLKWHATMTPRRFPRPWTVEDHLRSRQGTPRANECGSPRRGSPPLRSAGYPKTYARDDIPEIKSYPNG
jgi:hypothetical protein